MNTDKIAILSGPMSGLPHYNYPAFDKADAYLTRNGWTVINPANIGREVFGFEGLPPEGIEDAPVARCAVIKACLDAITSAPPHAKLVTLPGWSTHTGARAEVATARAIGLQVKSIAAIIEQSGAGCITHTGEIDLDSLMEWPEFPTLEVSVDVWSETATRWTGTREVDDLYHDCDVASADLIETIERIGHEMTEAAILAVTESPKGILELTGFKLEDYRER